MSRHRSRSHSSTPLTAGGRIDILIEWVVGLLLVFAPLALGAVEAWSELVVVLLAGALALLLALKTLLRREESFVWSWAYLPMALFILLLAAQMIPLPANWVAAISPQTAQLKSQLLADAPDSSDALAKMTLSFYPHATAHDLRIVLLAAVVFISVLNVYRKPEQIKRLLIIVAAVGGAMAVLALMQDLSGAKKIFWTIYSTGGNVTSGTFVNYNNFSQFMNLSIGAGLSLLLVHQREIERGAVGHGGRSWGAAERQKRWAVWLGALLALGVLVIFLSRSRMGVLSTLGAGLVAGLLIHFRRRKSRTGKQGVGSWILAPIGLTVFVALLWTGFDQVYDRLATLSKMEQTDGGSRWQTLQDLPTIWKQFPLLGIGSGSHETFYPMYDRHADGHRTAQVENDYAQVLEETGWIGAGLVAAFVIFIGISAVRGLRASSGWTRVAPIGLLYGLTAVLIHSVSDFGQHLPAVAALSAVTCGLLVSLGKLARSAQAEMKKQWAPAPQEGPEQSRDQNIAILTRRPSAWVLFPRMALCSTMVLLLGWAVLGAGRAAAAESYWNSAAATAAWLEQNGWEGSADDFAHLMDNANTASGLDPDNALYRHRSIVFRWRKISSERDPENGDVLLSKLDLEDVKQIVRDLHAARAICPTMGANLSMAGQLERFVLDDPAGAAHIREGYRLSPGDGVTCFAAGLLDAVEGKWDDSLAKFKTLDDSMFPDIIETYVHQVNRPDLALAAAQDDAGKLMKLADALENLPDDSAAEQKIKNLAKTAKDQAVARIKQKAGEPGASAGIFGQMGYISSRENDHNAAIAYFRRALVMDYGNIGWRLGLARELAAAGDVKHAIDEARICLRLHPQDGATRRLIQELSVMPGAVASDSVGANKP